jgi:hypothetical protein
MITPTEPMMFQSEHAPCMVRLRLPRPFMRDAS